MNAKKDSRIILQQTDRHPKASIHAYFSPFPDNLRTLTSIGKGWCAMNEPHCLLCGRHFPTGLSIMGCFLCFPCEKRLRSMAAAQVPAQTRSKLFTLYCSRGS